MRYGAVQLTSAGLYNETVPVVISLSSMQGGGGV